MIFGFLLGFSGGYIGRPILSPSRQNLRYFAIQLIFSIFECSKFGLLGFGPGCNAPEFQFRV